MASISLEGVSKVYPNGYEAIEGLDLSIDDGEFMVVVGPSGCGKTTVLRMIAGPRVGDVRDHSHRRRSDERRHSARP